MQEDADIDDLIHAIESGDPLAIYILRLLGKHAGTACINLIYAFNPHVLLLSGPLFHRTPQLVHEINSRALSPV